MKKAERERRVREVAELLGLTEYLERKPGQLSGGQRQRVAMGRAIVREPSVFLMDEPLSNLDAKLRVQMRADIAALQARLGVTTVYVTHDQSEAMTLGHRVAVLQDGRLQQCDAPRALYERPANTFVAGFIGSPAMNLCEIPVGANGSVSFGGEIVQLPARRGRRRLEPSVVRRAAAGGARARGRRACRRASRWSRSSAPTRTSSASPSSRAARRSSSRAATRARVPGAERACTCGRGRRGAPLPPGVAGARQAKRVTASDSCKDSVKRGSQLLSAKGEGATLSLTLCPDDSSFS